MITTIDFSLIAENFIQSSGAGQTWDDLTSRLIPGLKKRKQFGLAWRVAATSLASGRWPEHERWLRQQQALCTYKDEELAVAERLADALNVLAMPGEALETSDDPETLSIGGAIYKRFWELNRQRHHLEKAAGLYGRAVEQGKAKCKVSAWTYAAVNVAFVLDLWAADMSDGGVDGFDFQAVAQTMRTRATEYRQGVIAIKDELLKDAKGHWWGHATLAEAAFGLEQDEMAKEVLSAAMDQTESEDWERESTVRQLIALAALRAPIDSAEGSALLAKVIPDRLASLPVIRALPFGKVGLSLSGGGFRASFYHVGVLARLAELDLLRWVDTLSCVSGGSIIGALYYLVLRRTLQTKDKLMCEDYIACVQEAGELLAKMAATFDVRTNAAVRALNPLGPSLTEHIGKMLEACLYQPAMGSSPQEAIPLSSLLVHPKEDPAGETFHPRLHNWRREDRVPMLVVNASTLNTGHNWQFTASWVGEPAACIDPKVDAAPRLRRFYWNDPTAPTRDAPVSLGQAVAASAAIPFFPPIHLGRLYPGHDIRLADGGFHDNQGIFSLDEQDCETMIVSDGSGQLQTQGSPSTFLLKRITRANDILMQACRRMLYQLADVRRGRGRLRERLYIHMKKGIEEADLSWYGGPPPPKPAAGCPELHPDVQRLLAGTRTDLDIFPRTLSHSLMYAGYVLAGQELAGSEFAQILGRRPNSPVQWGFLDVKERATSPTAEYLRDIQPQQRFLMPLLRSIWKILKR